MRGAFLMFSALIVGCSCKKDSAPAPVASQKCTAATVYVADPQKCELSCFAGEVAACDVASTLFQRGLHTRRDPGRALSIAAKGCDLGGTISCLNATMVFSGQFDNEWPDGGVYENAELEADYERQAKAAASRECAAGRFESCVLSASMVEGAEAEALAKRAVELMDKACAAKDGFACEQLATAYKFGLLDVKRDTGRSAALLASACTLGQPEACELAGNARRGCELGSGGACLAWSLQVSGDESVKALQRGCVLRDGRACAMLARQAEGEEAEKLIEKACAFGHEAACAE